MKIKKSTKLWLAVSMLGLSSAGFAESWITTGSGNQGDPLVFFGNEGTRVSVNGFRTDVFGNGTTYDSPYTIAWGSGIGVERQNMPSDQHTIGNNAVDYNWTDGILLDFGSTAVSMSGVTLTSNRNWGDGSSDKDFEVWARTGASTPGVPAASYSMWASNGWEQVAAVNGGTDNVSGTDTDSYSFNTNADVSSTQWIVVAINADSYKDAFKFKGFSTKKPTTPPPPGQVPVPGGLALFAIGAIALRRHTRKKD